jgi:hypothetical protein
MPRKPSKKNAPSKGLGDDVAKLTKATGIDKVVEKVTKALGIEDCGCKNRQEVLNKWFPHKKTVDPTNEELAFIRAIPLVNHNGKEQVRYARASEYRTLHQLYNKLMGQRAVFPTCKCDATRKWFVKFATELKQLATIHEIKK